MKLFIPRWLGMLDNAPKLKQIAAEYNEMILATRLEF